MPLRLTWTRTFPDVPFDFACADGARHVGRIYRITGGPRDTHWYWVMHAYIGGHNNLAGYLETKDEAARAVEDAYFKRLGEG